MIEAQTDKYDLNRSVILAEDIAGFRMEFERKVLEEGLPFSKWKQSYFDIFERYPTLKEYDEELGNGIDSAV